MMKPKTALHANPFCLLEVTTRDDSRKIVEAAEERSLFLDHDACQQARSNLTSPRTRLSAELAWMPGVAPAMAQKLIDAISESAPSVRSDSRLPTLARANLMVAASEFMKDDLSAESAARFIQDFAGVVESIDASDVLRDINADRAISGFAEVTAKAIEDGLTDRLKAYRVALKNMLDDMGSQKMVETMTRAVSAATNDGEDHGPALLDELVDTYEVEAQGFLQKEYENLEALVKSARAAALQGQQAVSNVLDRLEKVVRNWDRVAQPIQVSAKSRGMKHRQSDGIAWELRSLGIDLYNDHDMIDQAHRITVLLRDVFAELPDVAEQLNLDAQAIEGVRQKAAELERNNAEWARDITFRAEVGKIFKDELAISADGIRWKGNTFALDAVTRVRWGGVKKSVNGVPVGTSYTIAFGDNRSEQVVSLQREATYAGFTSALWRAVCVRLMLEMIDNLSQGRSLSFGDITIEDAAVTLTRHKLLGSNQKVRLSWNEVSVWSADGNFVIAKQGDKKTYGSASYIYTANAHILEHIVRGTFKKGASKLSDYLAN